MRRLAEEVIEQCAIEIFLSENPADIHWNTLSEEERQRYRVRAAEQLSRKYEHAR